MENDDLVIFCKSYNLMQGELASSARRGAGFPLGGARGSLTAHATIPTLLLFEMAESAYSPF
jgi:hypothetical protein